MGISTLPSHRPWARHTPAGGHVTYCRYCQHPIRHYPYVDWVDTTSALLGGTYDMCLANPDGGDHRPVGP